MNNKVTRERLEAGETVSVKVHGSSMTGKIDNGSTVTLSPDVETVEKNDAVFCKVKGHYYVHLVTAVRGEQYQISNNKGHVNGWITKKSIWGKVTKVE